MTQKLSNGNVLLLPMNNRICQQGRKGRSRGSARWTAAALVLVLFLFGVATSAQAAWYDSNWQYRKKLTIDYKKLGRH